MFVFKAVDLYQTKKVISVDKVFVVKMQLFNDII